MGTLACGQPGVAPGLDQYTCDGGPCAAPGLIRGQVVYDGPARGDAILLLFDTRALPPPEGNGSGAVAVARVKKAALFQRTADAGPGPFSAPFTFTQVPSGRSYRIRAFIDATGEFVPVFDYAQQPRAGDPAGASGDIAVAAAQAVTGIEVALTETVRYDPPSFDLAGGSRTLDQDMDQPVRLKLRIARLSAQGASFDNAHFALELDRDAQGNRRSTFKDGLDDVFPRVFLRQIGAADAAVVPCRTISTPVLPALLTLAPDAPPIAQDSIDVLVEPLALRASDLSPLPRIPAGKYQVVVVQRSGQIWTVPNQLGDEANGSTSYFAASQGESLTFAQGALPANSISGTVVWAGDPSIKSGNIVVQAYRADPYDPPPPVGAALPVRVQIIPAAAAVPDAQGFRASYRIGGLPQGSYVLQALDDVDENFSTLSLLRTPTSGDLIGAVLDPSTGRPATIAVSGNVTGKDVTLALRVPADPPAFEIDGATAAQMPVDQVTPLRFAVRAKPLSFPAGKAPAPQFAVQLVRDSGGAAVDADHDGLPDVWPRVFLVRLDPSDPAGLTQYVSPDLHTTRTQVIPAAVDPTPFLPALQPQPGGNAPPVLTDKLSIVVRPALFDAGSPGAPPERVPLQPGTYRIVLVAQTGQAWQIPNEAGSAALDPAVVCPEAALTCNPATVQTQSQSRAFRVGFPSHPAYAGAIAGSLTATAASVASAYVFAYAASAQPPFGAPLSADFHLGTEFQGGKVSYTLPNLPSGDYLVTAVVDTRGDFAPSAAVFAMAPGAGDLVAAPVSVTVGASLVTQDLLASAAMPLRPTFQLAGPSAGADVDLAFNGGNLASMQIQIGTVLDAKIAALRPDTSAGLALACGANGRPTTASVSIELIKLLGDAAGLSPELDAQGRATVLSGSLDSTQFASISCTPGSLYAAAGLVTIGVQKTSSARVDLLDPRIAPIAVPLAAGRYALSVTSAAGQTWRIPNQLQPALLDPAALLATPAAAQMVLQTQQAAVNVMP
jgi:hypothetical protein